MQQLQVLRRAAQKSFRSAVEVALLVLGHQTVLRALAVGVYAVPLLASLWQKRMGECTPINKERERDRGRKYDQSRDRSWNQRG